MLASESESNGSWWEAESDVFVRHIREIYTREEVRHMPDETDARTAVGGGDIQVRFIVRANKREVARTRVRSRFKATFCRTSLTVGSTVGYHDGYGVGTGGF